MVQLESKYNVGIIAWSVHEIYQLLKIWCTTNIIYLHFFMLSIVNNKITISLNNDKPLHYSFSLIKHRVINKCF